MKKLSLVIAALAMVLGITQCKKQENPVGGKLITQEVTFTTSFGDGSKLGVTETGGTLDLSWQVGDEIKVTDNAATPNVSTLECTSVSEGGKTGTFEGTITCIENAELTFTVGNEPDYMDQHFTEINESEIYLVGESDFEQSGNYEVDMTLPYAILKVDLTELATAEAAIVSVKIGDAVEPIAKVTGVKTGACQVYLLLPLAATGQTTLKFTNTTSNKTITHTYSLAPNGFYTGGGTGGYAPIEPDTPTAPAGALPRLFTVSAGEDREDGTDDDVKVWFSQGNLQYVKSSSTWQFAANQYETVEGDGQGVGEDYANQGIVGLFGWGTSGWDNGNEYFLPYNTHYLGEEDYDPEFPENPYRNVGLGYGPIKDGHGGFNLTDNYEYEFAEADWGVHNAIANGGNEAGIWRTLSGDEWYYLFDEYSGHEARRGKYKKNVMVNGVRGFLIAPDDWNLENYPLQSEYNGTSSPLTWEAAEDAGLVFLPAAGYRDGTYVSSVNEDGSYWSSSIYDENDSRIARNFFFLSGGATGVGDMLGFKGAAVRLVSEKKN